MARISKDAAPPVELAMRRRAWFHFLEEEERKKNSASGLKWHTRAEEEEEEEEEEEDEEEEKEEKRRRKSGFTGLLGFTRHQVRQMLTSKTEGLNASAAEQPTHLEGWSCPHPDATPSLCARGVVATRDFHT